MSINLKKGQKISLSKENAGLSKVIVGLGWDEVERNRGFFGLFAQDDIDCDATAFLLKSGKLVNINDIVYFGNLSHSSGCVNHMGDNLTGEGEGDDEQIVVDLENLPREYDKVVFVVNIYNCRKRKQHFGMIENAFIRIVDSKNGKEICKYNLTENYSNMTGMIFGEIYRYNNEWKFNAIGQGTNDENIEELAKRYI